MKPTGHERRQDRTPEEVSQGLAARSLREGVPVDELALRLANSDGSIGPDASKVDELCDGAKGKLLAMAGYTTEKAAAELKPAHSPEDKAQAPEKVLTLEQKNSLFATLEGRITSDKKRYKGIDFAAVKKALDVADESILYGLFNMEENGHEIGIRREVRGGKNGFRFDSCSASSPAGVRDIDYPRAEEIAEKEWGVPLMPKVVFIELRAAGIITEKGTWSHLKTDAEALEGGLSWCGLADGVDKRRACNHSRTGGFRCSLWVPAVY